MEAGREGGAEPWIAIEHSPPTPGAPVGMVAGIVGVVMAHIAPRVHVHPSLPLVGVWPALAVGTALEAAAPSGGMRGGGSHGGVAVAVAGR